MEHDFPKNEFACHYVELLVVVERPPKLPKHSVLRTECTHMFLYVFGHCGKYMLGLLLILISKSWGGGVSPALLFASAVFILEVFSQVSSQQHM
jgi:hypothetical protein